MKDAALPSSAAASRSATVSILIEISDSRIEVSLRVDVEAMSFCFLDLLARASFLGNGPKRLDDTSD